MTPQARVQDLITTVDVRELHTIRWGPIRQMFPRFVEEIEVGRYVKALLAPSGVTSAVALEPHRDDDGTLSSHVFDIYRVEQQSVDR